MIESINVKKCTFNVHIINYFSVLHLSVDTLNYIYENYLINWPVTFSSSGSKAAWTNVCDPLAADFKNNHAIGFMKNLVKLL